LPDPGTDLGDLPGEVAAADGGPRAAHPELQPGELRVTAHDVPVSRVDRGGAHPNEHVPRAGVRPVDVLEPQSVGGSVLVLDDRLHRCPSGAHRC